MLLIQNIAIYEITREVFGNMESFTNPFARCFLDSQHQFRVLFFSSERFIGSTSFHGALLSIPYPKQIRNLGKRCLSPDLRSRLIVTRTIIHIRILFRYFADGKNTGYIFRQNIRGI